MSDKPNLVDLAEVRARMANCDGAETNDHDALTRLYGDLVALIRDTEQVADALQCDLRQDAAQDIAAGRILNQDQLAAVIRQYERVSWLLHGQLSNLLKSTKKY